MPSPAVAITVATLGGNDAGRVEGERMGAMGFLRRLRGSEPQSWPPPGPITSWPSPLPANISAPTIAFDPAPKMVDVVGEGSYQGTIEGIAGGRTIDGARDRNHTAILLPEPTNPYDPNAVRVVVMAASGGGGLVGDLSREDAVRYRPVIDRLASVGKVAGSLAAITGGWDRGGGDRGSFGVRLSIGTPEELMADLDANPALLA